MKKDIVKNAVICLSHLEIEDITYKIARDIVIEEYEQQKEEIERLNNIINECSNDILKELEENHHLSYGVALAIRQKLLDYKEVKGDSSNE